MKFKCPVCKSVLEFDVESDARAQCQKCDTSFSSATLRKAMGSNIGHSASSKSNLKLDQTASPKPELKPNPESKPDPRQIVSESMIDVRPVQARDVAGADSKISHETASLAQWRRKKQKKQLFVFLALAATAIAMVFAVAWVIRSQETDEAVADGAAAVDSQPGLTQGDTPPKNDAPFLPSLSEIAKKDDEPAPPPKLFALVDKPSDKNNRPANRIKPKSVLDDCWFRTRSYLVELQADTSAGPRYATGCVVDSRGWIATSFQAMAGATAIHVRKARDAGSLEKDALVDTIRGVLASSPEHDLLLLAVNRRLVDTFEDLEIASDDKTVASQYLVQCQPPVVAFPYSALETRVSKRAKTSALAGPLAERLNRIGASSAINWILHEHQSPLRAGAILLNDEGKLVAMNTGLTGEHVKKLIAVPAGYINELKQSADDSRLTQLPIGSAASGGGDAGGDQFSDPSEDVTIPVVAKDSSDRQLSETLNRAGAECELFGWWPQTKAEEEQLRELLQALMIAARRSTGSDAADPRDAFDEDDSDALQDQVAVWFKKLELGLGVEAEKDHAAQLAFNRKFANTFYGQDQPFAAFAFVRYSVVESPRIAVASKTVDETIAFEFKGTDGKVITNAKGHWPPMPPDSSWLIIGLPMQGEIRLRSNQGDRDVLQMADVEFVIQADAP